MPAEAKAHRERAERAADETLNLLCTTEEAWREEAIPIIARETYPTELVEAAKRARDQICSDTCALDHCRPCATLTAALALYPKPEQETPK